MKFAFGFSGFGLSTGSGNYLGTGAAVVYPPADLFAFSDSPASGNTYVRDRPGWLVSTSDIRVQSQQLLSGGNFSFTDGFNTGGFAGQDLGRTDGGFVTGTLASTANPYILTANWVDEQNYIYATVTAARNRIQIFKIIAGASTSVYDSGAITAMNVGDTVTLVYSWSGSTCTLTLLVNAARYPNGSTSWTVAASGLLQPNGHIGVRSTALYSAYSCGFNGAVAKPRLALNKTHRIYQRAAGTNLGSVPFSGVAKGLTTMQFRLLQAGSLVSGWDFGQKTITGLTVDPVTGVFSGSIDNIPQGVDYQIEWRDSADNSASSLSRKFDVGVIALQRGQSLAVQIPYTTGRTTAASSNAWYPGGGITTTSTDQAIANPFDFESEWDWTGSVPGGATGRVINLSNTALFAAFRAANSGVGVSWYSGGFGSTKLAGFLSSSVTTPYTTGPSRTLWANFVALVAYVRDFEVFIWDQGQEDAGRAYNTNVFGSTEATQYKSDFASFISAIRALTGRTAAQLPVIIVPLGVIYPPSGTIGNYTVDAAYDLFRKTQYELTQLITNCSLGASQMDLTLTSTTTNEVHLSGSSDTGYVEKACRIGYDMSKAIGSSATDRRGAIPLSMASSGVTLAITFDANTATALTCAVAASGPASNFKFWTDNTFATPMTPTLMSIGALSGGQFIVTFTFAGSTAAGNVVTSGKGGAFSTGGGYPDMANALKATQADTRSVVTYPILNSVGYLVAV